ncbi:prepilin peptidase [Paenibacillus sp. OV219]|uniref:A24 family peptidase n=1 Tax=Paenibacillus sp. OV219 TaxID=1884377 RepID=UPI0008B2BBE6|nr:prepilin peptidase [Paenibacillus sp. OV219]SEN85702.1 prepilin peptidase CpaA [Paenibacillus sp. OV219]
MGGVFVSTMVVLLVAAAFVNDIRSMRIPNALTASFFGAGVLYHLIAEGLAGAGYALVGGLAGLLPLLVLYALRGIGAGDVKFFAALGAVIGAVNVLYVLMNSILYGGLLGALMLAFNKASGRKLMSGIVSVLVTSKTEGTRFPFMIAVVPGVITAWYFIPA